MAYLFLVITLFLERCLCWNTFSIQLRTSSLFLEVCFCICDRSASEVNLKRRASRSLLSKNGLILLSPLQTSPNLLHCSYWLIDLTDSLPHCLSVFRNMPILFQLMNVFICICSASYSISPLLFLHLDTFLDIAPKLH